MLIKSISFTIVLTAILFASFSEVKSQFHSNPKISAGVLTTNILGENRAKLPMVATGDENDAYTGGSFGYTQPGITLRGIFNQGTDDDLRIVTSLDYLLFTGRERIVINRNIVHLLRHNVNILGVGAGVDYSLLNLGFANARIVAGADVKMYYIHGVSAEIVEDFLNDNLKDNTFKHPAKSDGLRFGGNVKLGVEGRLRKNIYVNAGASVGAINLLGREDERGELLTPLRLLENSESLVPTFQVYILIQYNL